MSNDFEKWDDSSPHGPKSFYKRKRYHYLWPWFWWSLILVGIGACAYYGLDVVLHWLHTLAQKGGVIRN